MKAFKLIYKEEAEGYGTLTIYAAEKGMNKYKIADIREKTKGVTDGGRIDSLLYVLLTSMKKDRETGKIFSDSKFEITYKDKHTEKVLKHTPKNEELIDEYRKFYIRFA